MTALELKLDYFRIYDIVNRAVEGAVSTRGQFDPGVKRGKLQLLDCFAACTMKNREPLFNRNAHLTWYRLLQESAEPTRRVTVRNQFGETNLWIGKVEALLCPAQKMESRSTFPEGLDHFKVYRVLDYGKPPGVKVALKDQFGSQSVAVLVPDFFAVPVTKIAGGRRFPIVNPKAHLVVYRTTEKSFEYKVPVQDQFGKWPVQLVRAFALAVPSMKRSWK